MKQIQWKELDAALSVPAAEFCGEIGLEVCEGKGVCVSAEAGEDLSLKSAQDGVKITYRTRNEFFRALTFLPEFLENGKEISQTGAYKMLCYMGDCSRNAVYNLPTAKQMIRTLAGMGYDSMMLYTEDTYELPDYKYFGYMRGRFTSAELKELDDYAYSYGIELIPCIQTLAHLATALRWPDFAGYKDCSDILLVGDDRTYRFIEAALRQCAACFRSRKINIGMDEAHALGTGEYLKLHGLRAPADIMLEHLHKVVDLCHSVGFRPMIWSDMFFRMAFDGQYYVKEGSLPQDVVDKVPDGLDLVYWDYYTMDRERFSHMMDCHAQFRNETVFAGGAWKWYGFGAHNEFSLKSTEMQLDVCAERGVDRVIVTSWGDNGGEASQFSAMASVLYFAERCYCGTFENEWLDLRAQQCLGTSLEVLLAFDLPDKLPETNVNVTDKPKNPSKYLLYNDLLERLLDRHMNRETVAANYTANAARLMELAKDEKFGYALETLGRLCRVLSIKADMGWRLHDAYLAGDKQLLAEIADEEIPQLLTELEAFLAAFRRQWYKENKTFGFITQEIRIGGLMERIRSVKSLLEAYVKGEVPAIEELAAESLPMSPAQDGKYLNFNNWRSTVAAGIL